MSQSYVGIYVMLAAMFLPKLGLVISNEDLTTSISVIVTIVGAVWAAYGRYRLGGVTLMGLRKM